MTSLAYISSGIRAEFRSPFWDVHAFLLDPTTLSTFPSEMVASPQFRLVGGDNTDWIHSGQMAGWASTVPLPVSRSRVGNLEITLCPVHASFSLSCELSTICAQRFG